MDHPDVRRQWADRTGEYSPAYYAHYGPDETSEAIGRQLDKRFDPAAHILELGFGSGRHLSQLYELGFRSLSGVDVNDDARQVLADSHPELADAGTFYYEAIEDVIDTFETDQFDAVYSVETLQHLHPAVDWVFEEIARITENLLITVENEGETAATTNLDETEAPSDPSVTYVNDEVPLYHRDWNRVFTELGFVEVASQPMERDTLRVFSAE